MTALLSPIIDMAANEAEALSLLAELDDDDILRIFDALQAEENEARADMFGTLFPEIDTVVDGAIIHARAKYPKHMAFFEATAANREVLFLAANRVGKTVAGSYAVTCWTTGRYPDWWQGKRFPRETRGWVAGDTLTTTREILQNVLLGDVCWVDNKKTVDGTGMIPRECIGNVTWRTGAVDTVDTVMVKHISGRWSQIGFKSYDQGRRVFQGTAKHWIWADEECPEDVFNEMVIRTATTNGSALLTFTPLKGVTPLVLSFINPELHAQL